MDILNPNLLIPLQLLQALLDLVVFDVCEEDGLEQGHAVATVERHLLEHLHFRRYLVVVPICMSDRQFDDVKFEIGEEHILIKVYTFESNVVLCELALVKLRYRKAVGQSLLVEVFQLLAHPIRVPSGEITLSTLPLMEILLQGKNILKCFALFEVEINSLRSHSFDVLRELVGADQVQ